MLKSRETEPKPISTPYGDLPAKTPADVTRRVAKTIGDFRYVDPDASLETLLDVYAGAATDDERKPLREAAFDVPPAFHPAGTRDRPLLSRRSAGEATVRFEPDRCFSSSAAKAAGVA